MLVREWEDELHLLSAVSPAWFRPGDRIEVREAPTFFGPVSAVMEVAEGGWSLRFDPAWRTPPSEVVVHVPWFFEVTEARADGAPVEVVDGAFRLPAGAWRLEVRGSIAAPPDLSYDRAVQDYRREYAWRYERFRETGELTQDEHLAGGRP
jgi:hypothetical protein